MEEIGMYRYNIKCGKISTTKPYQYESNFFIKIVFSNKLLKLKVIIFITNIL